MDLKLLAEKILEIEELLKKNAEFTETALEKNLSFTDSGYPVLSEAMRYAALGGGKRIRAGLVMECYRAFGGTKTEKLAPVTAAIEMIHAYSLIHDDLPCMDDAKLRRGKPSAHKKFGEAAALLAGDALLTEAFAVIAESELLNDREKAFIINDMAKAAGQRGMVGGQMLDLLSERENYGEADIIKILKMYNLKTGYMIIFACRAGAFLAGAETSELETVLEYGKNFGFIFQITDDILDIRGNSADTGKDSQSDEKNNKNTFAKIYGIEESEFYVGELAKSAFDELEKLNKNGKNTDILKDLIKYISCRTR